MKTRPVEARVGSELPARPHAREGAGGAGFAEVLAEQGAGAADTDRRVGGVVRDRGEGARREGAPREGAARAPSGSVATRPTAAPERGLVAAPLDVLPSGPGLASQLRTEVPSAPAGGARSPEGEREAERAGSERPDAAAGTASVATTGYVTHVGVLVVPQSGAARAGTAEVVGATAWEARVGPRAEASEVAVELPERVTLTVTGWTEGTARRLRGESPVSFDAGAPGAGPWAPQRPGSLADNAQRDASGAAPRDASGAFAAPPRAGNSATAVVPGAALSPPERLGASPASLGVAMALPERSEVASSGTTRRGRRSTLPSAPQEVRSAEEGPAPERAAALGRGDGDRSGDAEPVAVAPPAQARHPHAGSPSDASSGAATTSGGGVAEGGGPPSAPSSAPSTPPAAAPSPESPSSLVVGPLAGGMVPAADAPRVEGAQATDEVRAPERLLEAPGLLPDHLVLEVRDDAGRWTMDLQRHALGSDHHGLDVLLRGDAQLVRDLRGADHELRSALAQHGTTLLSLDVRADARGGGGSSAPPPSPQAGARGLRGRGAARRAAAAATPEVASVARATESASVPGRLDRLA